MTTEKSNDIGAKIKTLRKDMELNQTEFAKKLGDIDQSIISKWERGLQKPNGERMLKLIELSGKTPDFWMAT